MMAMESLIYIIYNKGLSFSTFAAFNHFTMKHFALLNRNFLLFSFYIKSDLIDVYGFYFTYGFHFFSFHLNLGYGISTRYSGHDKVQQH